ncbi:MAG: hypothetical protein ACOC9W_04325 [Persicimonas sp.]
MKRLLDTWRPALLVAGGFIYYLLFLGFRGTGTDGVALLDRLHGANRALMEGKFSEFLASPHPFIDAVSIGVAAIGDNQLATFGIVSALAVSLTLPAIWRMTEAACGTLGAALATGLFLGLPPVAGAATAVGEAAIVLALWVWLLRLSTLTHQKWWTTTLLVLVASALALSWAPVVFWLFGWLLVYIVARSLDSSRGDRHAEGMLASMSVPVGVILAPLAAVAVPSLLFVANGMSVTDGWGIYLDHSLFADWAPVVFAGETFAESRPPLTTGFAWLTFEYSPHVVIAAIAALVLPATEQFGAFADEDIDSPGFELPRSLCFLTLFFVMALPWALRTDSLGGVPAMLLAAPILAILAGAIFATLVRIPLSLLEERGTPRRTHRAVLVGLFGLFLLPGLVETAIVHPFEGSYYSWFADSTDGAIESGHPAMRDDVLPIHFAQSAARRVEDDRVELGEWAPHFDAYLQHGYVPPLTLAGDDQPAQARFYGRDEVDLDGSEPAKRVTWSMEGTPIFLLDFRDLSEGE